jgi:hypothetical protein
MADSKVTALTETTTLKDDDILYAVINPATTPESRKIKKENVLSGVALQSSLDDHINDTDNPHSVRSNQLVGGIIVEAGTALYFAATGIDITSVGTIKMMKNGNDIETSRWDGANWIS